MKAFLQVLAVFVCGGIVLALPPQVFGVKPKPRPVEYVNPDACRDAAGAYIGMAENLNSNAELKREMDASLQVACATK